MGFFIWLVTINARTVVQTKGPTAQWKSFESYKAKEVKILLN